MKSTIEIMFADAKEAIQYAYELHNENLVTNRNKSRLTKSSLNINSIISVLNEDRISEINVFANHLKKDISSTIFMIKNLSYSEFYKFL